MEFGTNIDRQSRVIILRAYINPTTDIIDWGSGQNVPVRLPEYELFTYRVFLKGNLPIGLENNRIYYLQRQLGGSNPNLLFLSTDDIDNNNPFDFTTENLEGFVTCEAWTVDYKYTTFPCIERAATNVQDMFCCPPKAELNTNIPEFLTLDTGSEDDSGDYYLATYKVMNSVPNWVPPLGYQPANLAYKSRNKPYVPITRMQTNIYAGPSRYETVNQMYTIAWEMMTDHQVVNGLATGNIRIKVLCTVWALTPGNMPADGGGLKTLQEYYSEWVHKDEFDYDGTCTILNNMDADYFGPSVMGYYETPAGLPIPHTVSVSRSAANVTMPSTLYLNMPDAVFVTPEGNIPLGNIAEALNYDSILGAYYSDIKDHYLIKGRYYIPFNFYPVAAAYNPFNPNRMGIGFGQGGINSQISESGDGLFYDTITNQGPYYFGARTPPLYFTNDIEERGPFVGSLSEAGAGFGGIFSGLAHGKPFIDSRAKVILTGTAAGNPIFDLEGHVIGVSLVGGRGSGYITPPTVVVVNSNAICVATLGEGEFEGQVISVTVTNATTNWYGNNAYVYFSPPPPPYFRLKEKNRSMDLFYSSYESAIKRQPVGTSYQPYNFYKNYFYYITSFHPDAYITSLTSIPPPPS
jgi:hypothetical protein